MVKQEKKNPDKDMQNGMGKKKKCKNEWKPKQMKASNNDVWWILHRSARINWSEKTFSLFLFFSEWFFFTAWIYNMRNESILLAHCTQCFNRDLCRIYYKFIKIIHHLCLIIYPVNSAYWILRTIYNYSNWNEKEKKRMYLR